MSPSDLLGFAARERGSAARCGLGASPAAPAWWSSWRWLAFACLAAVAPLLAHPLPPLVDLPGHVGRYRILAEANAGPLAEHFAVGWALIGNLGVDLLVLAAQPLLDVEPATRLVVTLIPLLTVLAMLWLAYEAHGELPPAAGFALPLAYAFPFQLGFVNFCLAQALAFAGLALWLRLARAGSGAATRALIFAPIACLVWLTHSFGWAMLGLFVLALEWRLRRDRGERPLRAALRATLCCAPMAIPIGAMLGGGDRLSGDTGDWFNLSVKLGWVASLLRERWQVWDVACVGALACLLWAALRSRRLRFAPVLVVPAIAGLAAFLLLPRLFQGGSYVDMRLLPATVAMALLAIRAGPGERRLAGRIALAAAVFLAMRTTATTTAFGLFAQDQAAAARAIDALPTGGAALVLVDEPGNAAWSHRRWTHIAGLAIARRRAFVNEQWALPGQQLIRPRDPRAAPYDRDPSHLVYPSSSEGGADFARALREFDRCVFDVVWTIGFVDRAVSEPDLALVWRDQVSAVHRVQRPAGCAA